MFDTNNTIHDTAYVHHNAILGEGNVIGAFTVIEANVEMGDNNIISHHVTIGTAGEVRGSNEIKGKVIIGDNNVIREFTSIQSPQRTDYTIIDNDCFIMDKCHIAHDNIIESNVTIAPLTSLGGCVLVQQYANIGMGVVVHPRTTIGESSMLGMGSVVTKDIPPFETWYGNPAKGNGYNLIGLNKRYPNKSEEELIDICAV
jgi:UDP-N-acetylglucosamine acyltransferase